MGKKGLLVDFCVVLGYFVTLTLVPLKLGGAISWSWDIVFLPAAAIVTAEVLSIPLLYFWLELENRKEQK